MANGIYTRSVKLPHSPVGIATFLIVEKALGMAWAELLDAYNFHDLGEKSVNYYLCEILSDHILNDDTAPDFNSELFETPNCDTKVRNFNGVTVEKMPDILIRLRGRSVFMRSQDGLFIECKHVDKDHSITSDYCRKGIRCFIDGEYAWAMPEALMIGYVTGNYTVALTLINALKRSREFNYIGESYASCFRSKENSYSKITCITKHKRNFCYMETKEKAPDITLRHLWLKCN